MVKQDVVIAEAGAEAGAATDASQQATELHPIRRTDGALENVANFRLRAAAVSAARIFSARALPRAGS